MGMDSKGRLRCFAPGALGLEPELEQFHMAQKPALRVKWARVRGAYVDRRGGIGWQARVVQGQRHPHRKHPLPFLPRRKHNGHLLLRRADFRKREQKCVFQGASIFKPKSKV